ncbi:hypothetical protein GCM10010978_21280 [Compostibacillus humi]|uniref:NYN domain-containing protein n=1 Tax=Compostibacillus humi TaxID=1245525 RepID=A0A8J2TMV0_9BACI|nr:NYN domain-containing protein [Compostibacillus humi]GFZ79748.1 hypothetical protein GCM10010978_21280 [Compostibacillus humi]HLT55152.1 NYN domain-containing protein [Bacillota bacterium]
MVILVVDGYNIIGAWSELQRLKEIDIGQARDRLIEMMAEYQAITKYRVIIVFDAYYVKGIEKKEKQYNIEVIFTKEKETADERIEKLVKKLMNVKTRVYVATSDYDEQRTIFGQGALRKSARELYIELEDIRRQIRDRIEEQQKAKPQSKALLDVLDKSMVEKLEKMRRGEV